MSHSGKNVKKNTRGNNRKAQKVAGHRVILNRGTRQQPKKGRFGRRMDAPSARGMVIHSQKAPGMRVRKREFIGDVGANATRRDGTKLWKVLHPDKDGPLTFLAEIAGNIGLTSSFPWISTVARNFERFVVHTMDFKYEPSCPSTTPGTLAIAPTYNAGDVSTITTKQDVLDRKDTVRTNLWNRCNCKLDPKMLNGISKEHFIRSGPVPTGQDIKTYDPFKVTTLVEGAGLNTADVVGELWVDYEVELINPLPEKEKFVAQYITGTTHASQVTTWTALIPETEMIFGTQANNNLTVQMLTPNSVYLITVTHSNTAVVSANPTIATGTGCTAFITGLVAGPTPSWGISYNIYLRTAEELAPGSASFLAIITFPVIAGGASGTTFTLHASKTLSQIYDALEEEIDDLEQEIVKELLPKGTPIRGLSLNTKQSLL